MDRENFIFVTDVHFNLWSTFSQPDDITGNSRFTEQLEKMQDVFDLAREYDAVLINGGDLFHVRNSLNTKLFNKVYDLFVDNSDVPVIHCVGNHDKATNSLTSPSTLDTFSYIDNNQVFSQPDVVGLGESRIYVLPYGDETTEIKEWLSEQELDENKVNILVGHLGLEGASTGTSNHRLEGAFTLGDLRPDDMDTILLGHYHNQQKLGGNDNFIYGGSLFQNNFGETHETGVWLGSLIDKEQDLKFIPVESKQFVTVEADDLPENLEEILDNHYVRYSGTTADVKALSNVREDLSNVQVDLQEDYTKESRLDIEDNSTPEEIVAKYVEQYMGGDKQIIDIAVNALKEVQE